MKNQKFDKLLQPSNSAQISNFNVDNINNLNNSEVLSGSELEKKGSSELNLQEESSQTSKNSIKNEKTKDNIRNSFSRKNTPSLADMMININNNNNNNNNNNSSSSSQKTIAKPFNKNGLLNKSQLKLASYIEQNKDITLQGTKRFTDKSGEYYLKNVQLKKKQDKLGPLSKKLSLTKPQNLDNCFNKLNGNINKIRRNATKIITILPENSLTPIPVKEQSSVRGMAQAFNKRQYENAERVAVFIRRMEYSNGVQHHFRTNKKNNENENINDIIFIQQWWKNMFKIIKIQKWTRGFLFRKNLMKMLEHQENILKFITTFYNIHGFHLYRAFFDNLKKISDYVNSKRTEMLEDFGEKMEKLEKRNNIRKLQFMWLKWKKKIKDELNNEKAENFWKNKYKRKSIKALKMNYILKLICDSLGEDSKKLFDKIYNNKNLQKILKAIIRLNKVFNDNNNTIKKDIFERMKLFYFTNILFDIKNILDNNFKKVALDKIKKLNEYLIKKVYLKKWKVLLDLNHIINKLIIKKRKEIENNKQLLLKDLSIWKTKKDIKHIINQLKNNKNKEKILVDLIKKLNELKNKINSNNKKEVFELLKKLNNESNIKKPHFNKIEIKLIKKGTNSDKIFKENENDINNDDNLDKINNINNENNNLKKFKKRIAYRKRNKKNKKIKKDKLKQKFSKLKNILLLSLIRLYKNKNNKIIKKYFDNWKNNNNIKNQTYFKKVISGNNLNKSKDSKLSDKNNNKDLNKSSTKNIPKCYTFTKEFNPTINPDNIFDELKLRNEELSKVLNNKRNINKNENDVDSDTSVNLSRMSGMNLKEEKSENLKPIIYTSQSFVIDRNTINNIQKEIPKINIYKNINNKYPMKMKGDFGKLIDKNKDLLKYSNPRIQITNATCEIEQFSPIVEKNPQNNANINNINILNINPNISINMKKEYKKKDLKKVVRNCDKDIYEPNKDYEKEEQRWISMSIPLDNDMAKWEFLDNLKGIRNKNNMNKFELIQKNKSEKNINTINYNIKNIPGKKTYNGNSNTRYKLNEMNYKQYYKSLFKDDTNNSPIKLIKYEKNNKKDKNNYRIRSFDINIRNKFIEDNIKEMPEEAFE